MLENNIAVPLYAQLKEKIISAINNEELKYGDRIETEQEIMKRYNLSRITVRRAITELVDEGYLVKRQGKGTFVVKNKIERKIVYNSDSPKIMSFTKELKENNIKASSLIVEIKAINGIEDYNEKLLLDKNAKLIYMKRVRCANDSPMTIEENYFPYDRFKFLLNEKVDGSLYQLLEEKYNIFPTRSSRQELEIVRSDEEQSRLLNVPVFEPLFYFFGITYDEKDVPIHIAKRYIIGSKYKFIV